MMCLPIDRGRYSRAVKTQSSTHFTHPGVKTHPWKSWGQCWREKKQERTWPNLIWPWGQGKAPDMPLFKDMYGVSGSIISAVDLIKGIGKYAGLNVIDVPELPDIWIRISLQSPNTQLSSLKERDLCACSLWKHRMKQAYGKYRGKNKSDIGFWWKSGWRDAKWTRGLGIIR